MVRHSKRSLRCNAMAIVSHRRQTQITCSRSAIKATERPFQASRVKSCVVVKAAFIPQGFELVQLMLAYCCTVLQHGDASRQLRSGITINPLCSSRRSTIRPMERLIFKLVVRRITSQFGVFSVTTLARSSLELILISIKRWSLPVRAACISFLPFYHHSGQCLMVQFRAFPPCPFAHTSLHGTMGLPVSSSYTTQAEAPRRDSENAALKS